MLCDPNNPPGKQDIATLRRRRNALPANQRRYYCRLMRLDAPRFYRTAMLSLEPGEFAEMVDVASEEELVSLLEELRTAAQEQLVPRPTRSPPESM